MPQNCVRLGEWQLEQGAHPQYLAIATRAEGATTGPPPGWCSRFQGSQFTSEGFTSLLSSRGAKISMDRCGRWLESIFIERLWRSFKHEEVDLKAYENIPEARKELASYFDF
jgi:putative transposase